VESNSETTPPYHIEPSPKVLEPIPVGAQLDSATHDGVGGNVRAVCIAKVCAQRGEAFYLPLWLYASGQI
jgi:hypothetical protein